MGLLLVLLCGAATSSAHVSFAVGQSKVQVELEEGALATPRTELVALIRQSAEGVAEYFGHLPAAHLRIVVEPVEDDEAHGTTYGGDRGATIFLSAPRGATRKDFEQSWVLVHELVHTALPRLPDAQHWAEEGLATYVEPLIRAKLKVIPRESIWQQLMEGLPQGVAEAGPRGLNHSPGWASTYWGGALFWFLADVELREASKGRRSIQTALRERVTAGFGIEGEGRLPDILEGGGPDGASTYAELRSVYERLATRPFRVDLVGLWKRLGVSQGADGRLQLHEDAPLAWVRRDIERGLCEGCPRAPTAVP